MAASVDTDGSAGRLADHGTVMCSWLYIDQQAIAFVMAVIFMVYASQRVEPPVQAAPAFW